MSNRRAKIDFHERYLELKNNPAKLHSMAKRMVAMVDEQEEPNFFLGQGSYALARIVLENLDGAQAQSEQRFYKGVCKHCRGNVVFVLCNGDTKKWAALDPKQELWDWWMYCANPICDNHKGEGMYQDPPDWVLIKE